MPEPTSSGVAGAAAFKAVGGVAAGGALLSTIVVMLMTPPRSTREWAVGVISTMVTGIGGGAIAVELFGADRIGHGTAAGKDPELLELLSARGICVEVCPISNRLTGAVPPNEAHPLQQFRRHGVPFVICVEYVPWNIFDVMCPVDICGGLVRKARLLRPAFDISTHNSSEDDLPLSLLFGRLSCSRSTLLSQKPSTEFGAIG